MRHTESGWATELAIIEYLQWLHLEVKEEPIVLVLDVYPTHRTDAVKQAAEEMHIELLYVPAGATSLFQPLDRRIFGELKSRARGEFGRLCTIKGDRNISPDESVTVLEDCWKRISAENVKKAWQAY
jgi:hypothetical protein